MVGQFDSESFGLPSVTFMDRRADACTHKNCRWILIMGVVGQDDKR